MIYKDGARGGRGYNFLRRRGSAVMAPALHIFIVLKSRSSNQTSLSSFISGCVCVCVCVCVPGSIDDHNFPKIFH